MVHVDLRVEQYLHDKYPPFSPRCCGSTWDLFEAPVLTQVILNNLPKWKGVEVLSLVEGFSSGLIFIWAELDFPELSLLQLHSKLRLSLSSWWSHDFMILTLNKQQKPPDTKTPKNLKIPHHPFTLCVNKLKFLMPVWKDLFLTDPGFSVIHVCGCVIYSDQYRPFHMSVGSACLNTWLVATSLWGRLRPVSCDLL